MEPTDPLARAIWRNLRTMYASRYVCPDASRRPGAAPCEPWFSFTWLSRFGEPGRIRVWVSCATAEIDSEFEASVFADGEIVAGAAGVTQGLVVSTASQPALNSA